MRMHNGGHGVPLPPIPPDSDPGSDVRGTVLKVRRPLTHVLSQWLAIAALLGGLVAVNIWAWGIVARQVAEWWR